MLNNGFKISYYISILLILVLVVALGFTHNNNSNPKTVYNVYLDGDIIGTIEDKNSFEEYINKKENTIKRKYGVNKVYMPNGVVIKKVITYDNNIESNEKIYNKLTKVKQFTIKGTVITINSKDKKSKPKKIYTLSKKIFDDALESLVKSFVDKDDY